MTRMTMRCVLVLFSCCAAPRAQHVIPAGHGVDTVEARSYGYDLGRYAPMRCQYVYGSNAMPPAPLTVQVVAARADGGKVRPGGHALDVEIWMSSQGPEPAAGYSYAFAANRGPDFRRVMQRRQITFPSATGARPEPFQVSFPLDAPFTYQGGALLIEFKVFRASYDYFEYYLDAVATTGAVHPTPGTQTKSGIGCPLDFRIWTNPAGRCTGGLFYTYGYTGIPGASTMVVDFLGTSNTTFETVPLPFSLAPLGAPECWLNNDAIASRIAASSASATDGFTVSVWGTVPFDPSLIGSTFYSQWLALDPSFNAFGVAASESAAVTFDDGTFQGQSDCLHLFTYGREGGVVFTGDEGSARFADGRGLVLELR